MVSHKLNLLKNHGGPLYYLGNRNLTLPDLSGRMIIDRNWLNELFSIIIGNQHGKKFKRCIEPFSGCASWSLAAMELGIAEQYLINDSDEALIHVHRLMRDEPEKIKTTYLSLVEDYSQSISKKDFFLKIINQYNNHNLDEKSLLLPFIINHSWGGIVYHDEKGTIVFKDAVINGKVAPGNLDQACLSVDLFVAEVDRVSEIYRANQVIFRSGDFIDALSDTQSGDFVALNPPYPENSRARWGKNGMYRELYDEKMLHANLVNTIRRMEAQGIYYYMTYGFHDLETKQYIIKDHSNCFRHYFRVLGYPTCAFGTGLDQMYFHSNYFIPDYLQSIIIPSQQVLQDRELDPQEALKMFNAIAKANAKDLNIY